MLIREATPADWVGIWPILHTIGEAGETLTYEPGRSEESVRASWMRPRPGRTFVAIVDGRVAGSAYLHPNHGGNGAHVANAGFVVDPASGGRGIGRALCAHVLDQARADGYRAMQFNAVVETNTHAVRLWQSFGFRILATVPEAFHHPVHGYVGLHVMHLTLR
ncbi:MAG: GNAT family N-acetyltransferase [Hamadaea sp.]|nr:GNAT family N-acetyltransferase [Hamadaea sp.]